MDSVDGPVFEMLNRERACAPVLISVPHAGRCYPSTLMRQSRLGIQQLSVLEDRWCDLLAADCAASGLRVLSAQMARAVIDLNRAPDDMDVDGVIPSDRLHFAAPGRKARAGLGLVPTRLAQHGTIWRGQLSHAEISRRLALYYEPYHSAVAHNLNDLASRFGHALLIDLHSMPSLSRTRGEAPVDLVVGDAFGSAAPSWMTAIACSVAGRSGFRCGVNQPYAGGQIIRRHAAPSRRIFAIQLEFDRLLYLDRNDQPQPHGVARLGTAVRQIAEAIHAEMAFRMPATPDWPIAAE